MTAGPVTTQQGLGRGVGGDPVASGHSQHLSPLRCHKILQQNYLQLQLFKEQTCPAAPPGAARGHKHQTERNQGDKHPPS